MCIRTTTEMQKGFFSVSFFFFFLEWTQIALKLAMCVCTTKEMQKKALLRMDANHKNCDKAKKVPVFKKKG